MRWMLSFRASPTGARLADNHYSRQSHGSLQFVPPGPCVVLRCEGALWVTSSPDPRYVKHAWAGAWICSIFRNERPDLYLSSELIREAVAATRWEWPNVPDLGMVTFVDPAKTTKQRGRANPPGTCFVRAGFFPVGFTQEESLPALQLVPGWMPPPAPAIGATLPLVMAS